MEDKKQDAKSEETGADPQPEESKRKKSVQTNQGSTFAQRGVEVQK